MDNGNLAWLDYSVPAWCFRNNIPCMKEGVAIQMYNSVCQYFTGYNKPFALSFHSSSG